jgi:hypothetical protein
MDFSKLNTKADAEAGSILHFVHPQLGHPLYTGEGADEYGRLIDSKKPHSPVTAKVRGIESDVVRERARQVNAAGVSGLSDDDSYGFAASLVIELNGVYDGDRKIEATPDGLRWFFGRAENLGVQVIRHAQDRTNFFKAASLS